MGVPVVIFQPFERKGCAWPGFPAQAEFRAWLWYAIPPNTPFVRMSINRLGLKRAWIQKNRLRYVDERLTLTTGQGAFRMMYCAVDPTIIFWVFDFFSTPTNI